MKPSISALSRHTAQGESLKKPGQNFASLTLEERFEAKYVPEPNTGCWLWTGAVTLMPDGSAKYSKIGHKGKTLLGHRVAYELHRGPIPEGLTIDHLCRVKLCVNPDHLEAVTIAVNVSRAVDLMYPGRNRPASKPAGMTKTHCYRGHEFSEENTLWHSRPNRGTGVERTCRICWVQKSRDVRASRAEKRREAATMEKQSLKFGTRIGLVAA